MGLTDDRERHALHEGAHVAVALECGHRVRGVSIDPVGVTDIDYVRIEGEGPISAALRSMAVLYAGALRDPYEHMARCFDDPNCDEERAVTVALRSVGSDHVMPLIAAARERASVLVEATDPLIQRIADALLQHGSLDAAAITDLRKECSNGNTT